MIATISDTAAVHTGPPVQCSCTPKSPTVDAMTKAPSVEAPNPIASSGGAQCRHSSSSSAITTPATAFSMNAGPTTS
jgi:hypothetical protein